jgi:5-methylcytosine-specific restriction endonuclease McrA
MRCDAVDVELHIDHIKPRSRHPELSLTFSNLQVLCRSCNMEKWNHHATDYRDESLSRDFELRLAMEARRVI